MEFTPAIITGIGVSLWAVLLEWLPGLEGWFERLDETRKKQVVGLISAVTALGAVLWNCDGGLGPCLAQTDWRTWVLTALATLTSQPAHDLTKRREKPKPAQRRKRAAPKN